MKIHKHKYCLKFHFGQMNHAFFSFQQSTRDHLFRSLWSISTHRNCYRKPRHKRMFWLSFTGMTGWQIRPSGSVTSYQQCLLMGQVMKEGLCFLNDVYESLCLKKVDHRELFLFSLIFVYLFFLVFCACDAWFMFWKVFFEIFVRSSDNLCGFEPDGRPRPACAALHRPVHSW